MKISGLVIQERNISESTQDMFTATYKGKTITISTDHGFGMPKQEHLKRFDMSVVDIKTGMHDVQTYEDHHEIRDAIRSCLIGACLLENRRV